MVTLDLHDYRESKKFGDLFLNLQTCFLSPIEQYKADCIGVILTDVRKPCKLFRVDSM